MKIFCDGVWDLFHNGHVKHFKKIKELYDDVYLLVGVMSDEDSTEYKRKPYYNEKDRIKFIESCRYVDKVIIYESLTEDFINNNKIDLVVHASVDNNDFKKQEKYFDIPTKMNKMKWIEYNNDISTTLLLKELDDKSSNTEYVNEWQKIWQKKGWNKHSTEIPLAPCLSRDFLYTTVLLKTFCCRSTASKSLHKPILNR